MSQPIRETVPSVEVRKVRSNPYVNTRSDLFDRQLGLYRVSRSDPLYVAVL